MIKIADSARWHASSTVYGNGTEDNDR
jgi:hypothetical protein